MVQQQFHGTMAKWAIIEVITADMEYMRDEQIIQTIIHLHIKLTSILASTLLYAEFAFAFFVVVVVFVVVISLLIYS
jgi:hypothetical protein